MTGIGHLGELHLWTSFLLASNWLFSCWNFYVHFKCRLRDSAWSDCELQASIENSVAVRDAIQNFEVTSAGLRNLEYVTLLKSLRSYLLKTFAYTQLARFKMTNVNEQYLAMYAGKPLRPLEIWNLHVRFLRFDFSFFDKLNSNFFSWFYRNFTPTPSVCSLLAN